MRTTETVCPRLPAGDRAKPMALAPSPSVADSDHLAEENDRIICRRAAHRRIGVRLSIAVLGLVFPAASFAANHTVTARSDLTFSPSSLTITAGDTVTFRNGGGFHNVVSDPGSVTSFRCANGCDGAGGNGNLSSLSWSATVAFPTAGAVGYFCEAHGSSGGVGMSGRITIQAAPTATRRSDFNGDGRSDILWRNGNTGANTIWRSANSATRQAVGAMSTSWRVVGSGDYNGDGRSDILWRNDNTGAN